MSVRRTHAMYYSLLLYLIFQLTVTLYIYKEDLSTVNLLFVITIICVLKEKNAVFIILN